MPRQVILPGPGLIAAGRALEDPRRLAGKWPYQWLFPGPNSKHVLVNGAVPSPGPASGFIDIVSYQVPEGMRFSLRGVVCGFNGSGWDEGTGDLVFQLLVTAAGTRVVDWLQNIVTHLGSADAPYPILGRLEFQSLDVLTWQVNDVLNVAATAPNNMFAHMVGHTYPNSEAA